MKALFTFNKWVDMWVDNPTENRVNIFQAIHVINKVSKRELEEVIGLCTATIDNNLDTKRYWYYNEFVVHKEDIGK